MLYKHHLKMKNQNCFSSSCTKKQESHAAAYNPSIIYLIISYCVCFSFDFSLTVNCFLTYALGGFFVLFAPCVSFQFLVQRYSIVKTPGDATM